MGTTNRRVIYLLSSLLLGMLLWVAGRGLASSGELYLPLVRHAWLLPSATRPATPTGGWLLITDVMADPEGDEPAAEWFELANLGGGVLDLSMYKIGDSEQPGDSEGMRQFPSGAMLPPGGVIVIANQAQAFYQRYGFQPDYELNDSDPQVPDLGEYPAWANGNIQLTNSGDEFVLLDASDQIGDSLAWGDAAWSGFQPPVKLAGGGASYERWPAYLDTHTAADWRSQPQPAPGELDFSPPTVTPTATPSFGPSFTSSPTATPTGTPSPFTDVLLVSELLYNPLGSEPAAEWVELYNPGLDALALGGLGLGDAETPGGNEGLYRFPPDASIQPGQALVIAQSAVEFFDVYGFWPAFELAESDPGVPNLTHDAAWSSGSLAWSNTGDEALLLDATGQWIDVLAYGASLMPAFQPPAQLVPEAYSIERYPSDVDSDSAADWRAQPQPNPGQAVVSSPGPTLTWTPSSSWTPSPTPTSAASPTQTPTVTTEAAPAVINEIHADPDSAAGDANQDGVVDSHDDEFIEIANPSVDVADLSGWTLQDGATVRHVFPAGSQLLAGCAAVVFGGGQPSGGFGGALVQIASTGGLGLNNSGDTVRLVHVDGALVNAHTFGAEGGEGQSLTRAPDWVGGFVLHLTVGGRFSPGVGLDGGSFPGCEASQRAGGWLQRLGFWPRLWPWK